jgi:hypothetical protein
MDVRELLIDLFGRVDEHVDDALAGLDDERLTVTVVPGTNPIGWLIWHSTRVQDDHVSDLLEGDQLWVSDGWAARFGVDPDPHNTGYGHSARDVAMVVPDGVDALRGYHAAVAARTRDLLEVVTAADLDRIVDERWDPPVSLGVRLISVADDDIQHTGQALYLRGLLERR